MCVNVHSDKASQVLQICHENVVNTNILCAAKPRFRHRTALGYYQFTMNLSRQSNKRSYKSSGDIVFVIVLRTMMVVTLALELVLSM